MYLIVKLLWDRYKARERKASAIIYASSRRNGWPAENQAAMWVSGQSGAHLRCAQKIQMQMIYSSGTCLKPASLCCECLVSCIAFPLFTSLLLSGIIFEWVYGYTNTSLHSFPQKPREQKEIYMKWYLTSTIKIVLSLLVTTTAQCILDIRKSSVETR